MPSGRQSEVPRLQRRTRNRRPTVCDPRIFQTPSTPSMLETNLRALQLNIMKSGPRMEALINDHQSQNLDVLLIQEPSITTYRTHVNHSSWRLYRPTTKTDAAQFRSLVYVNRNISTSAHRQIPCDHPDVAAIKIWTPDSQILFFSVYIPSIPLYTDCEASAEPALTAIQNTITTDLQEDYRSTSIVLGGRLQSPPPNVGRQPYPTTIYRRR